MKTNLKTFPRPDTRYPEQRYQKWKKDFEKELPQMLAKINWTLTSSQLYEYITKEILGQ